MSFLNDIQLLYQSINCYKKDLIINLNIGIKPEENKLETRKTDSTAAITSHHKLKEQDSSDDSDDGNDTDLNNSDLEEEKKQKGDASEDDDSAKSDEADEIHTTQIIDEQDTSEPKIQIPKESFKQSKTDKKHVENMDDKEA